MRDYVKKPVCSIPTPEAFLQGCARYKTCTNALGNLIYYIASMDERTDLTTDGITNEVPDLLLVVALVGVDLSLIAYSASSMRPFLEVGFWP